MKVLFYLPSKGGGGGAHSVVQECMGMRRFGVDATLVVLKGGTGAFKASYPDLDARGVRVVGADGAADLAELLGDQDIAVATTFESVHVLKGAMDRATRKPIAGYYVQDYEPLFCAPGTSAWTRAVSSYTAIPDAVLFAKTDWLCDMVRANTGVSVNRVLASIDHSVYYPGRRESDEAIVISAMIRPKTRRRAPIRTARILEKLSGMLGKSVELVVFGASDKDITEAGITLGGGVENRGVLSRNEVAAVLRASSMFLDLSDFQAFGRTGLEAMASGCVPLLPLFGGADEYADSWRNAIVVDTRSDDEVLKAIKLFVEMPPAARAAMRAAGIEKALQYTIERAAYSEVQLFERALGAQRRVTAPATA